ncbi:MAG: STAS domain-containing protein [Verrucomicrobiota bacterium]
MNNLSSLFVAGLNDLVWFRVEGRGTHGNAGNLRDCAYREIDQGKRTFIIDLEECSMMDSTFMGTLSGIARKLVPFSGRLEIINANERNAQLLENLGLTMMEGVALNENHWRDLGIEVSDKLDRLNGEGSIESHQRAELILEAHQSLAEINPANRVRFKDVLHYLEEDLNRKS